MSSDHEKSSIYSEILLILDPTSSGYIDIESLKPLISKLPQSHQIPIGNLLRNYVFEYHSFQISCDLFLQLYMSSPDSKESSPLSPSLPKTQVDSFFKSVNSSLWPSGTATLKSSSGKSRKLRSLSPKKNSTYKELYQRKKSVEGETWQKSIKLFDRIDTKMQSVYGVSEKTQSCRNDKLKSFRIEKSQSMRSDKSQSFRSEKGQSFRSEVGNSEYRNKYPNFNDLLRIRQKHLEFSRQRSD